MSSVVSMENVFLLFNIWKDSSCLRWAQTEGQRCVCCLRQWIRVQNKAFFVWVLQGQLQALTPCGILTQNPWDYHRLAMLTTRSCDCRLTRARPRVYICHKCEVQIKNHKTKQCLYWQHILTSPHTQMTGFTLLVNQPSRIRRCKSVSIKTAGARRPRACLCTRVCLCVDVQICIKCILAVPGKVYAFCHSVNSS